MCPEAEAYSIKFIPAISFTTSFFTVESHWLLLQNRRQEALTSLDCLRGLPVLDTHLVQLTIVAYTLAQISGTNSITNYLPTISGLLGIQGSGVRVYISGLYAVAKLVCCIAASLILVGLAGPRGSLMLGVSIQIIYHSYLAGLLYTYLHNFSDITRGSPTSCIYSLLEVIQDKSFYRINIDS